MGNAVPRYTAAGESPIQRGALDRCVPAAGRATAPLAASALRSWPDPSALPAARPLLLQNRAPSAKPRACSIASAASHRREESPCPAKSPKSSCPRLPMTQLLRRVAWHNMQQPSSLPTVGLSSKAAPPLQASDADSLQEVKHDMSSPPSSLKKKASCDGSDQLPPATSMFLFTPIALMPLRTQMPPRMLNKSGELGRGGKGLRHFSMKVRPLCASSWRTRSALLSTMRTSDFPQVCEKVESKGRTTYNEVADELVRG